MGAGFKCTNWSVQTTSAASPLTPPYAGVSKSASTNTHQEHDAEVEQRCRTLASQLLQRDLAIPSPALPQPAARALLVTPPTQAVSHRMLLLLVVVVIVLQVLVVLRLLLLLLSVSQQSCAGCVGVCQCVVSAGVEW